MPILLGFLGDPGRMEARLGLYRSTAAATIALRSNRRLANPESAEAASQGPKTRSRVSAVWVTTAA